MGRKWRRKKPLIPEEWASFSADTEKTLREKETRRAEVLQEALDMANENIDTLERQNSMLRVGVIVMTGLAVVCVALLALNG